MSAQVLTANRSGELPGPEWLRRYRLDAAARAETVELPTPQAVEWRYSRIAELAWDEVRSVVTEPQPEVPPAARAVIERLGPHSGHVVTVDGVLVSTMRCAEADAAEVVFGEASDPDEAGLPGAEPDAFAAWNPALAVAPLVLDVPAGVELAAPFLVVHHLGTEGTSSFPRLHVRVGADSAVAVVEVFVSDDVRALSVPVTQLELAPAARVAHTAVQDLGPRAWQVGALRAAVDQEATLSSGVAVLGGEYARMRIDCRLHGRGATGRVASAYMGSASQMIDLRTFQDHEAADTTSELYFKGALADRAHSVYSGLIRIQPGARGSNAVQANRVVKLGEHTWAESVPNLEIENNDVRCSHASAVGPVDADQRFYLESRGVPPRAAERLIVGGFFDDALGHFPVPEAVDFVSELLDGELDREVAELGGAS